MSTLGADPGQLDALATQFDQLATDLGHRRTALTAWIEGDRFWRGGHADEFRHLWATEYSPQVGRAVDFLHEQIQILRDNANQQRVASGEQPKDYSSSFLNKLWGTATKDIAAVEHKATHGISSLFHRVEQGVEREAHDAVTGIDDAADAVGQAAVEVGSQAYTDFKVVGGNPEFQKFIQGVSVVGDVAGIVAILPIPGVQEVAAGIALGSAAIVMAGHLAERANTGTFDKREFAEDGLGVFGSALGLRNAIKVAEAAKAAAGAVTAAEAAKAAAGAVTGPEAAKAAAGAVTAADAVTEVPSAKGISIIVKDIAGSSDDPVWVRGLDVGGRAAHGALETWSTTDEVAGDVRQGNYLAAANDGLGYVDAAGEVLGVGGQIIGGGADAEKDLNQAIFQ